MEPEEYMSPDGHVEQVANPVVAVRLRARGWWPVVELREQASVPGPAAEWLKRAETAAEARRQRQIERAQPPASAPAASPLPVEEQAPLESAAKKTAAKKTSK